MRCAGELRAVGLRSGERKSQDEPTVMGGGVVSLHEICALITVRPRISAPGPLIRHYSRLMAVENGYRRAYSVQRVKEANAV